MRPSAPILFSAFCPARSGFIPAALGFAVIAIAGCTPGDGADDGPIDARVPVPPAPSEDEALQFVMPETIIPAGEEKMMCWIPDFDVEQDYLLTHFQGWQYTPGGHHVVALKAGIPQEKGTVYDCTQIEQMTDVRPLINPDPSPETRAFPDGYAIRLRAGTTVVLQSHYINYGEVDMNVADVARIDLAPADSEPIEASYIAMNHGGLDLPVGESASDLGCTLPEEAGDVEFLSLFGHMHGFGKDLAIDGDFGAGWERLYTIDEWEQDFRDNPPVTLYDPAGMGERVQMQPGDRLNLHCAWNNTSDTALRFPSEMCAAVATYFPARLEDPVIICDEESE